MKIGLAGLGIDATPEMADVKTMFPIVFNGWDKEIQPALIQGSPAASVIPNGVTMNWRALYGYYIPDNDRWGGAIRGDNELRKEMVERNAFDFGWRIMDRTIQLVRAKVKGPLSGTLSPDMIEVQTDEVYAIEDKVMDTLENELLYQPGRVSDRRGHYRWIGLGEVTADGKTMAPSNEIVIPNLIEGKKDLHLYGNVVPVEQGTSQIISVRTDNFLSVLLCGIFHRFEDWQAYSTKCALRAAHFQRIFGKSLAEVDKLLAAASRVGVTPRISTQLMVNKGNDSYWAVHKLMALSIACKFAFLYYIPEWRDNEGSVEYHFSGTGSSTPLEQKIVRYTRSNALIIGRTDVPYGADAAGGGGGAQGLYYFPSTNKQGAEYRICFAGMNGEKYVAPRIEIRPVEGIKVYGTLDPTPLQVNKDQIIQMTEEQQVAWRWFPVLFDLSRSVSTRINYIGAGLKTRFRSIRDPIDKEPSLPSELLKTMMLGWNLMYEPISLLMRNNLLPSRLDEFQEFEIMPGVKESFFPIEQVK